MDKIILTASCLFLAASAPAFAGDPAAGQKKSQTCAACHGVDGKGNQAVGAPNLTDGIWLYGSSEATIIEGINKGRHADGGGGHTPMPAHKDSLGAGKVHILAAYVWGLSNKGQ